MNSSLAVSQALATSRHQGAASVLSRLPQRQTHRPQPASPCMTPDKVDRRWRVLPSTVFTNMMENQEPRPQRVNVAALCRDCVPASQGHLG